MPPCPYPTLSDYQEALNLNSLSRQLINYYAPARIPIITVLASTDQIVMRLIRGLLAKVGLKTGIVVDSARKNNKLKQLLQNKGVEVILHSLKANKLQQNELLYQENELLIVATSTVDLTEIELESKQRVLNIDKKNDLSQKKGKSIYCSLNKDNLALQRHIKAQQPAVFTTKDNLVLFDGVDRLPIIALDRLNASWVDNSEFNTAILFTTAVAFVFEIPIFMLRSFLIELTSSVLLMNTKEDITIN